MNEPASEIVPDPGLHFERAYDLYLQEEWEEALTELDMLVSVSPSFPNAAWLRAGLLRRLHGDLNPCVLSAYDLVVAIEPANAYAQIERADILRVLGRTADARDIYARYTNSQSDDEIDPALQAEALFKLGCVALVLQEASVARSAFQSLLALDPDYPDAAETLALIDLS